MSLIDFPNVPALPGVPDLRRSGLGALQVSGLLGKIQGLDVFGLLNDFLTPRWAICDPTGKAVITPDSVVSFDYKGESRIANFPIEKGAFSSYNKVQMPYDIRLRMTCSGSGTTSREVFLTAMGYLKDSLDLYMIVTPDKSYPNVNLENFDYRREASNGVTLLTVDAMFTEVRVAPSASFSAAVPAGSSPVSTGVVNVLIPTPSQEAAITNQVQ